MLDTGLDLGKTAEQSLELLRSSQYLAGLGYPLLLSASNKAFLGVVLGLGIDERRDASLAAAALGISRGCRVVRAHDVAGTVRSEGRARGRHVRRRGDEVSPAAGSPRLPRRPGRARIC